MDSISDEAFALVALLIFLLLAIVAFFIFRFLVLWYYKIDKRVELLQEQNRLLKEISNKLTPKNRE